MRARAKIPVKQEKVPGRGSKTGSGDFRLSENAKFVIFNEKIVTGGDTKGKIMGSLIRMGKNGDRRKFE
jgi:hypothetical protein